METKKQTSIRISQEAKVMLARLQEKLQMSQTALIELAIRELAAKWGIK
jgi:predicted transcriptional regulator